MGSLNKLIFCLIGIIGEWGHWLNESLVNGSHWLNESLVNGVTG